MPKEPRKYDFKTTPERLGSVVPNYGDDSLAARHPMPVVVEARVILARDHIEDDFAKVPRRVHTAEQLDAAYEQATDTIALRNRRLYHDPSGLTQAEMLAPLQALSSKMVARMRAVACGGHMEPDEEVGAAGVGACTPVIAAACAERSEKWCPQAILAAHRRRTKSPRGQLIDQGVPEDIADFVLGAPDLNGRHFDAGPDDEVVDLNADTLTPMQVARAWLNAVPPSHFLLLAGGTGNGKSSACAWLCVQVPDAVWASSYQIAAECRRVGYIDRLIAAPLLVIDEIGGEDATEASKAAMNRLVYQRASKRTAFTMNVARAVLTQRYDARLVDRIAADPRYAKVIKGESLRRREG